MYSFLHFPWHCSRLAETNRQTADGSLFLFKIFENMKTRIAKHYKFAHAGGSLFCLFLGADRLTFSPAWLDHSFDSGIYSSTHAGNPEVFL